MRIASEATVFTTSPAGMTSVTAVPVLATWCPMTWTVRYAAFIQLVTASWWRRAPQTAWKSPSAITIATHRKSSRSLLSMTPWSIAAPTHAQMRAWLTIQPMPNTGIEKEEKLLLACDPHQITKWRTRIRCAGVRDREFAVGQV